MKRLSTLTKLRLASAASRPILFSRQLTGRSESVTVRRRNLAWELNLKEGIDFSIYLLGGFEKSTLETYARLLGTVKEPIVIDVGANCGSHALPLAEIVSRGAGGKVFALEPAADAYARLCRNVALNPRLDRSLIPLQVLAWSNENTAIPTQTFSSWPLIGRKMHGRHPIHGGLLSTTQGAVTKSIDSLVSELEISKVDLIKVDVDGNEFEVIDGSIQTIERFRPTLMIEWAPHLVGNRQLDLRRIIARFVDQGYELRQVPSLDLVCGGVNSLDYLASPNGSINFAMTWKTH